jgi:transmembrane sensor
MAMSSVVEDDDIDDIAAQWVLRQDRGALSPQEQRDLDAWLESSSRHRGAFVRAQAMWFDLDRVAALNVGSSTPKQPVERRPEFARAASVAAVLLAAATLFAATQTYLSGREATELGEMRRIALDDGSAVALNTASVMQVKFGRDQRRIVLRRGEASFQVAHDMQRPFIVQAGDVSVRAVGTAFNVRMLEDGGVGVVVTDGVVEITRNGATVAQGPQKQRVVRNHEVIAEAHEPLATVAISENDLTRRLAWKEGQLVFDGEPLDQAVTEVNRYAATPVRIESEHLAARSFVGVFRTGDARAFAYAAAAAFNARVRDEGDAIYITE